MRTGCLQIGQFQRMRICINDTHRLLIVGQTKEQMQISPGAKLLLPCQLSIELTEGIVRQFLIHHIFQQTECKRRMHTIATALAEATYPKPKIAKRRCHGTIAFLFASGTSMGRSLFARTASIFQSAKITKNHVPNKHKAQLLSYFTFFTPTSLPPWLIHVMRMAKPSHAHASGKPCACVNLDTFHSLLPLHRIPTPLTPKHDNTTNPNKILQKVWLFGAVYLNLQNQVPYISARERKRDGIRQP